MNRVPQSHLPVTAITHAGLSGKNNEDRYAVTAFHLKEGRRKIPQLLAVLSDGIGGHRGGEVAAEMAVTLITSIIGDGDARYPLPMLERAIQSASQQIFERAQQDIRLQGMGATVAAAWVIDNRLYSANVGDSRIYLLRGEHIVQVSSDHTWIQEALEAGLLDPQDMNQHPNAHIIRRFLGSPTPPDVDLRLRLDADESDEQCLANQGFPLSPQDIVLLCSDGLTDLVNDAEILAAFQANPLEEAAQTLLDLALERGGHDNITLVAMQQPEQSLLPIDRSSLRWLKSCIILGLGMMVTSLLTVLAFWGYSAYIDRRPPDNITPTPRPTATLLPPLEFLTPGAGTLEPQATPGLTLTPPPTLTPTPRSQPQAPSAP